MCRTNDGMIRGMDIDQGSADDEAVAALAGVVVGSGLYAALGGLDESALDGFDSVLVLQARTRQANHDRAQLLRTVNQVIVRQGPWGVIPAAKAFDYACDEVRAALRLT